MRGLLEAGCASPAGLPRGPLGHWLAAGLPSLHALRGGHPVGDAARADGRSELDALAMVNVAVQLDVLRGHGITAELMGLFLDIPTARVLVLDGPRFRRLG
jgi:carbonic anhydrase